MTNNLKSIKDALNNIYNLFKKRYNILEASITRPAFIRYADNGYSTIKDDFDSLIINLKKEVNPMDARDLVLTQLEALNKEKTDLVAKVVEAENEKIEAIKLKAAEEAEALYKKEIEDKVAGQFKIAEEHLTKLLAALPEKNETEQTSETEDSTEDEEPLI